MFNVQKEHSRSYAGKRNGVSEKLLNRPVHVLEKETVYELKIEKPQHNSVVTNRT